MRSIISFLRFIFIDPHPERDETHASTRYAMMSKK